MIVDRYWGRALVVQRRQSLRFCELDAPDQQLAGIISYQLGTEVTSIPFSHDGAITRYLLFHLTAARWKVGLGYVERRYGLEVPSTKPSKQGENPCEYRNYCIENISNVIDSESLVTLRSV